MDQFPPVASSEDMTKYRELLVESTNAFCSMLIKLAAVQFGFHPSFGAGRRYPAVLLYHRNVDLLATVVINLCKGARGPEVSPRQWEKVEEVRISKFRVVLFFFLMCHTSTLLVLEYPTPCIRTSTS